MKPEAARTCVAHKCMVIMRQMMPYDKKKSNENKTTVMWISAAHIDECQRSMTVSGGGGGGGDDDDDDGEK